MKAERIEDYPGVRMHFTQIVGDALATPVHLEVKGTTTIRKEVLAA